MITVRLSGGMGNQMFQYACGRALALRHGVSLALDVTFLNHRVQFPHLLRPHFVFREYALDVFNIEAVIAEPKHIAWWNRPLFSGKLMLFTDAVLRKIGLLPGWEQTFQYDPQIEKVGPNTYLAGFWQSEKYFSSIADTIRANFTLKEPLHGETKKLLDEMKSCVSLCIHVRRGDIIAKSFHGTVDKAYYQEAFEYLKQKTTIEKIYVFSEDAAWCQKELQFQLPTIFVGMEHAGKYGEGHLALMCACTHFIIPNSTFSWWAAWLGNNPDKQVLVPKKWFSNKIRSTTDLLPPSWIAL